MNQVPDWGQVAALVVAGVFLLMSGLVSASEAAFFSLLPSDVQVLKDSARQRDRMLVSLLGRSDRMLTSLQIADVFLNVGFVALCAYGLDAWIDGASSPAWWLVVEVVGLTLLLVNLGEILPKIFAQGSNVRVALTLSQPLLLLRWVFYPMSYVLIRTSSLIGEKASHYSDISIEELADAVDMTTASSSEEQKMLSGIVTFANRDVDDIMRPRLDIKAVEYDMSFGEVKRIIIESGYSRLPVYDDDLDHIKGTLFVKDLLQYINMPDDFDWRRLVREPYFVPTHKKINSMLEDFQNDKVHMAIVVDEYGATQGLVSLEDILEEVVGEITDESDTEETFYRRLNENTFLFDGKTHIVDMLRVLELDDELFEDVRGRAETIAGLMLEINRDLLKKGDEVSAHGIRMVVHSVEGHRIEKIKVIVERGDE